MKQIPAKDFLQYASGIALIIGSITLLIFTLTNSTVKASPGNNQVRSVPVGVIHMNGQIKVVGYRYDAAEYKGEVEILATADDNL